MKEENNIYYKMEEWQQNLLKKVEELMLTDFEAKGDFISIENMWNIIDEMSFTLERTQEELEKMKRG